MLALLLSGLGVPAQVETIRWTGGLGLPPSDSWRWEGDTLHLARPGFAGSLFSAEPYDNFDLTFEWRVAPRGNSGVKYMGVAGRLHPDFFRFIVRPAAIVIMTSLALLLIAAVWLRRRWRRVGLAVSAILGLWTLGCAVGLGWAFHRAGKLPTGLEYQMTDDAANHDALSKPSHRSGALYDLIPPTGVRLRPAGEFNTSRILVDGRHVEHWLNGAKVVEYDFDSPALRQALARSKFAGDSSFARKSAGYLELQDHGDEVWFRNIRLRRP